MTLRHHLRSRLAEEGGFTLAVAMGIMLIASIISIAAFEASRGDILPSKQDHDRRVAYTAAESGIAWYQNKLASDPDLWRKCDSGSSSTNPINQPNVTATARTWKTVSGSGSSVADFSIALLPVSATCVTSDPYSMLSSTKGTFRIRSTGRYHGQIRTIVATMRRSRFLDYVYLTNFETLDPVIYPATDARRTQCADYRAGRAGDNCSEIQFADVDAINGPLHTNDSILFCGAPDFGRSGKNDKIEVSSSNSPGYFPNGSGCGTTPNFLGPFAMNTPFLQLPPSNAALRTLALPGYIFSGTTYIRFTNDGNMTVDKPGSGTGRDPVVMNVPSNGVIYVDDDTTTGCSTPTTPDTTAYTDGTGCGDIYVSGTANAPVTIGSARDIVIAPTNTAGTFEQATPNSAWSDEDLKQDGGVGGSSTFHAITGSTQIGLIANRYIRVYHPINSSGNAATNVRSVRIDAAILALADSFIVDNWNRGGNMGTLTVNGAISQRFRGPVGTGSGGNVSTGYAKDYWYDDRLKYASPPYFLDPINSAWSVGRESELVPAV